MINDIETVFSAKRVHRRRKRTGVYNALKQSVIPFRLAASQGSDLHIFQSEFFDERFQELIRQTGDGTDTHRLPFQILNRSDFLARDDEVRQSNQRRSY